MRDDCVGTDVKAALHDLAPRRIAAKGPLQNPRYVGRDLTWNEWLELPHH